MIRVVHPTGNTFVRALLQGLERRGLLETFQTTLGWAGSETGRRIYPIPTEKLKRHPARELLRLTLNPIIREFGNPRLASSLTDWVYRGLDKSAGRDLAIAATRGLRCVYAYEDGALDLFRAAGECGVRRCYDLPIAFWETTHRLLSEEAERRPDWAVTLGAPDDSKKKLERKTAEITLADVIVCPSHFVARSIPKRFRTEQRILVVPFGTPPIHPTVAPPSVNRPLRVLFAGTLSQRKGLADVFDAVSMLDKGTITLTLLGAALLPLSFYRKRGPEFTYAPPRNHEGVLKLMREMDLLVLPSIVEGRALVQQEAMAMGLPVIATPNAGAEDLITDGKTGFLVPIRNPEMIAERLYWCVTHRKELREMGFMAAESASALTWESYSEKIIDGLTRPSDTMESSKDV